MRRFLPVFVLSLLTSFLVWLPAVDAGALDGAERALVAGQVDEVVKALDVAASPGSVADAKATLKLLLSLDRFDALGSRESNRVYQAGLRALARMPDPAAREFLREQIGKARSPQARVLVAHVLGLSENARDHPALVGAIEDRHVVVVLAAIERCGAARVALAVAPLIDLVERLEDERGLLWVEGRRALTAITGEDFETIAEWRAFWEVRGATFDPDKDRGGQSEATTVSRDVPQIFGTEILSRRIVFLLDISNSMKKKDPIGGEPAPPQGWPEERRRLTRAKSELIRVINSLDPKTRFNVIAFENQIRPWQRKSAIVPATPANKRKAVEFVEALKPQLGTATDHALEEAFRCERADTFYLLTDGEPWRDKARLPTRPILEDVRQRNRFRGVRIMSLGFREANERFLKNLSRSTRGTYRAID